MRVKVGMVFGSLVVEAQLPSNAEGRAVWSCRCSCGGVEAVVTKRLSTGKQIACKNCQYSGSKSPLSVRLKKYMVSDTGCWEWTGKQNALGYGVITVEGTETRAHRAMYFMQYPDADRSKVVMHQCDNPRCINPEHLQLGTQKENIMDMLNKGRGKGGAPKGNRNAVGNKGWMKGGVTAKYVASKLGDEVDIPEELK